MGRAEFWAQCYAKRRAREDEVERVQGILRDKAIEFVSRDGLIALAVTPIVGGPGFRVTRFDRAGPFGHKDFRDCGFASPEVARELIYWRATEPTPGCVDEIGARREPDGECE